MSSAHRHTFLLTYHLGTTSAWGCNVTYIDILVPHVALTMPQHALGRSIRGEDVFEPQSLENGRRLRHAKSFTCFGVPWRGKSVFAGSDSR